MDLRIVNLVIVNIVYFVNSEFKDSDLKFIEFG
jgi:hypothetical protein